MSIGIIELNARVRGVDKNALLIRAVEINKEKLIKLNQEQLLQGLNTKGQKITPKYVAGKDGGNSRYAIKKNQQNSAPGIGTPDLNLSGYMFSQMDLQVGIPNDNEYTITSYADYTKYLDRYLNKFGLTKQNEQNQARILVTNTFNKLWKEKVFA